MYLQFSTEKKEKKINNEAGTLVRTLKLEEAGSVPLTLTPAGLSGLFLPLYV